MTKEEKKLARSERKEARRERRAQNPSQIRKSISEVSEGVQGVREMYREMNAQLQAGYEPEETDDVPEEPEETKHVAHMRHAKGKFKIRTKPTTMNVLGLIMDNELRTPAGVMGVAIDVVVFLLFVVSLFSGSRFSILLLLAVFVITVLLIGPVSHLFQAYEISKRACSPEGGAEYTFSASGFDIAYSDGEYVRFGWDKLYRAQESKNSFYIFLDEGDGLLIPKADIAAAGRKPEQFEELLEEQVRDKFKKTYFRSRKAEKE